MNSFAVALDAFHFIRPLWLLLLPVVAGLWWIVRRTGSRRDLPTDGIAPHLRAALTVGAAGGRRPQPVDGGALGLARLAPGAAR
ncbi:MAG TPA: VWA domain-containing protein, partial [Amaricoccus sp.]|nr:VWA domain-containing protein [Amaricoccus sp.]